MPQKKETKRPEIVLSEITLRQVASLTLLGASSDKICSELILTKPQYTKITTDPRFKDLIRELAEDDKNTGIAQARTKINKLLEKAVIVLESHLDKNSLDAAKVVFKAAGLDEAKGDQGDTTLTVILPGAVSGNPERVIEIDGNRITKKA